MGQKFFKALNYKSIEFFHPNIQLRLREPVKKDETTGKKNKQNKTKTEQKESVV